ncbi:dimethylaniline monooxygenase [N-oxide-forming] [Elysia marginata]|uniref:Flavin-containing monooxygenase n=1 Tax=Elysia marginata TaxID=1093978 RepID=A0AAV4FVK7_9GAST|nr:dimethylaniline monooxygenase [N-oxide-forming] [Elysia marginata]
MGRGISTGDHLGSKDPERFRSWVIPVPRPIEVGVRGSMVEREEERASRAQGEGDSSQEQAAVLGAGVSGLTSIKSCLEEGLDVVCYESRPCLGGIWSSTADEWNLSGPTMYKSLISNTSKSMTCFSDFPCPASYPPYLPHYLYQEYLLKYAEHFQLLKHIKFSTRVLKVLRAEDHASTGRWRLTLKTCLPGEETDQLHAGRDSGQSEWEEEFDGVIAATGFYSKARTPDIAGLSSSFPGNVSHAYSYREPSPFHGKTVLVIGSANTAVDIAVEVSSVAKQVYLSIGDGMCLTTRIDSATGLPSDLQLRRALHAWLSLAVSTRILTWIIHKRTNHRSVRPRLKGVRFYLKALSVGLCLVCCGLWIDQA